MNNYVWAQWAAFFVVYCFVGWCIESAIVSVASRKVVNRGVLIGPVLPLYGSGAIVILVSTAWIHNNIFLVYVLGTVGTTILEYITGAGMEAVTGTRYWDYSDKMLNYRGYICLKSSLFWGVLSVVLVYIVHPIVSEVVLKVDINVLMAAVIFTLIMYAVDTIQHLGGTLRTINQRPQKEADRG